MFRLTSLSILPALFSFGAIALAVPIPRATDKPLTVEETLKTKDFYDKPFKFSDDDLKQIEKLSDESKDPIVRVRARKIVVDRAGNGRDSNPDLTKAAFKYLESKLDFPGVKALLVEQGFSHYTTSAKADGSSWFLIEHVAVRGFNGGINLKYDSTKKQIVEMQAWGAVPADK